MRMKRNIYHICLEDRREWSLAILNITMCRMLLNVYLFQTSASYFVKKFAIESKWKNNIVTGSLDDDDQ